MRLYPLKRVILSVSWVCGPANGMKTLHRVAPVARPAGSFSTQTGPAGGDAHVAYVLPLRCSTAGHARILVSKGCGGLYQGAASAAPQRWR
jgi:hypothetical protein